MTRLNHRSMPNALLLACAALAPIAGADEARPAKRPLFRVATMVLPAELAADMVETRIEGIGGKRRGEYRFSGYQGRFTRSASRLAFFDVFERRYGDTRYSFSGPEIETAFDAQCVMDERSVTLGVLGFTPRPMAYRCSYSVGGNAIPARFELQEARTGVAGAMMKAERRGEVAVPRAILQIRSVHQLEGSRLQTATPIGYVFELDGRAVAAIELNGKPRFFLARDANIDVQRAAAVGAVALAVFWDPADSALD